MQIRQIACMTCADQHAVLLMVRVEVRSRGRKGWIAFANLVQVDSILTRLQILEGKLDEQTAAGLHQVGGADGITFLVLDLGMSHEARFGAHCGRKSGEQNTRAEKLHSNTSVHHESPFAISMVVNN